MIPFLTPLSIAASKEPNLNEERFGSRIIVPGMRIGDISLGMNKNEVLRILGEPKLVYYGSERYALDELPRRYGMNFGEMSVFIENDKVQRIDAHSPSYRFISGLTVGDLEGKIKQSFGKSFESSAFEEGTSLTYEDKGVCFEIDKQGIIEEIHVFTPTDDHRESDAPTRDDTVLFYEPLPGPLVFPKVDRRPRPDKERLRQLEGLPQYDPESGHEANLDLRLQDVSRLDLSDSLDDLLHTEFDDRTVWPASDKMPSGFNWQKIMELGKNPGLGLRGLHQRGITGRGVRIAILDQPLLVDHQEYADRLQLYEEIHIPHGMSPQWHGPMVASVAVGKTVGVAPEAELFYIAQLNYDQENRGSPTLRYLVQGIYRLLEINRQLPPDNKIRAISISKGWTQSDKDYAMVAEAVQKAQAEGILMVFTSVELFNGGYDIHKLGRPPFANPDAFGSYGPAISDTRRYWEEDVSSADDLHPKEFYVPTDSRTTASPLGIDEYVFDRNGGSSKYPPYVAGIYALAAQVDPTMTPERFWALVVETGRTIEIERHGKRRLLGPILDPMNLIYSIETGQPFELK
jgi:hypothetical protein